MQQSWCNTFPKLDFEFWVKYGSWSFCPSCRSFFFDDKYFREKVYLYSGSSRHPAQIAGHRRSAPDDPVEHQSGSLGRSSRWWYLPGMYRPEHLCGKCTPVLGSSPNEVFSNRLRARAKAKLAARQKPVAAGVVDKTGDLYCIPFVRPVGSAWWPGSVQSKTWPKFSHGQFQFGDTGQCMLSLSEDEKRALQIIVLRTVVQEEKFFRGAGHQGNWKKTGLSRAYFQTHLVCEATMPTAKCKAAFRWLIANNAFYEVSTNFQVPGSPLFSGRFFVSCLYFEHWELHHIWFYHRVAVIHG